MALPDQSRQSLIPSFLYSSSSSSRRLFDLDSAMNANGGLLDQSLPSSVAQPSTGNGATKNFVIPAPKEKIELYSPAFYAACTAGGTLSCGLTHMAVTPLDLVKCNMQVWFAFVSSINNSNLVSVYLIIVYGKCRLYHPLISISL